MRIIRQFLLALVLSVSSISAFSAPSENAFKVSSIQVIGLHRVPKPTVIRLLPIKVGKVMTLSLSNKVITTLYNSGFFKDVQLSKRGKQLVIRVKERPLIAMINISGNKEITGKKLKPVLDRIGIKIGETFYPNKLNQVVMGLQHEYDTTGFHGVTVTPVVTSESRNRVAIKIKIHEGKVSKVTSIKIEGNEAFSAFSIRRHMAMSRKNLISWFTHSDRYSEANLGRDMAAIDTFYRNNGYIRFRFTERKATRGANGVSIILGVNEGEQYHIGKVAISGDTLAQDEHILPLFTLKEGHIFSLREMNHTRDLINAYYGNNGFAFPNINPVTVIDDKTHTVNVTFQISPGLKVYVRHIYFSGNTRTADDVLRREMRQLEGSLYSTVAVERSKERLNLLGFFQSVVVGSKAVLGHPDMVDLHVQVEETHTGKAQVQGGYDNEHGFLYGASVTEPNFMGTGDALSFGFQNSLATQNYNVSYTDPYYLPSGVSRGESIFYSKISNQSGINLDASYDQDGFGGNIFYGFPVTERDRLSLGYGYERVNIKDLQTDGVQAAVPSVRDFMTPKGENTPESSMIYDDFKVNAGWSYNGLDRAIFPTRGSSSSLGVEVGVPLLNSSLGYYITTYDARWFKPLGHGFILKFHGLVGYGTGFGNHNKTSGRLPFFKNFYAGGISSLPGFEANTLGPYNNTADTAIGGNLETIFGMNLIIPNPFSDHLRTSLLLAAGNVFQSTVYAPDTADSDLTNIDSFSFKRLRMSAGLMVSWLSPMGMLSVSLAWPISKHSTDQTQAIGFTFGGTF